MSNEEKLQRVLEYCEHVVAIGEAGRDYITKATVAGCKSTIAAIKGLQEIAWIKETGQRDYSWTGDKAHDSLNKIITEWEGAI